MFAQNIITPFVPCQYPARQNRRGLGYIAELIVTTMLSALQLNCVIALAPSIRPRPVSSQVSYRCVFASLQLIPQWACV
jgi:hypothetical protein